MSTTEATARTQHLFLTHGVIAIAWAAVFAAVSDPPAADVTIDAGALIVLYPLIDARSQNGFARRLLAGMLARRRRRAANPAARVLSAG